LQYPNYDKLLLIFYLRNKNIIKHPKYIIIIIIIIIINIINIIIIKYPKSANLRCPLESIRKLAGFKSLLMRSESIVITNRNINSNINKI
jgi:hypothetical protein